MILSCHCRYNDHGISPIEWVELDRSVYNCLTQLYGGRDMYNLLHKEQLHVSALFIGQPYEWVEVASSRWGQKTDSLFQNRREHCVTTKSFRLLLLAIYCVGRRN